VVLTLGLRSYPTDVRLANTTLMVRLGWIKGVFLHNLLLLSGFLLFGVAILFDLPVRIAGPVFTALAPAGYLIWIYAGLERGTPVRWPLIISLSLSTFFIPVYLITFTTWIF
jgi:1,4-dihydroxy-2-naphthoate octaprenyltransferase